MGSMTLIPLPPLTVADRRTVEDALAAFHAAANRLRLTHAALRLIDTKLPPGVAGQADLAVRYAAMVAGNLERLLEGTS